MMIVCSPIKTCTKNVLPISGYFQKQMRVHVNNIASPTTSRSCCHIPKQGISRIRYPRISASSSSSWFSNCSIRAFQWVRYRSGLCSKKKPCPLLMVKSSSHETSIGFSSWPQDVSIKILVPKRRMLSDFKFDAGLFSWLKGYGAAGLISGLLVCYSTSNSAHSEALEEKGAKKECTDSSVDHFAHGKKVYTDYSVIGKSKNLFLFIMHVTLYIRTYSLCLVKLVLLNKFKKEANIFSFFRLPYVVLTYAIFEHYLSPFRGNKR